EDANSWPRCVRKNHATLPSDCSPGTYTLRYIRSRLSTSSVVCSRRISPTVRGRLIAGSGRWGSLEDQLTASRSQWERVYRIPSSSHDRSPVLSPLVFLPVQLVGLRRSLVRYRRPRVGLSSPAQVRSRVVLPQPLGPSRDRNSPAWTSSVTLSS